jgi:putative ABC transport system permease protein
MNGIYHIALKLLINDKGKFFTLVLGITFAVFLMMQMTSTFTGLIRKTASDIINLNSKVWIMDPSVNSARDNIAVPSYLLDAVRSIKGVSYALPVFIGSGLIKLQSGRYQPAEIIGIDDTTLFGHPLILKGNLSAIYNDDAFIIIKDADYEKFDSPSIGSVFEVNDHRGVIVGIGKTTISSLFGIPTLYTTYNRAIQYLPTTRFTITYILVEPKNDTDIPYIKSQVANLGYLALTQQEFIHKNQKYYTFKTGIGTNTLIMTLISFIVGLSIAGQTFYTFVLENLEKFGALKAIGAQKKQLINMLLFQSLIVGFLGYGFGTLLSSSVIALARFRLPDYASMITIITMGCSFFMVLIIVAFSSYIAIRKVLKIEPFEIFRS